VLFEHIHLQGCLCLMFAFALSFMNSGSACTRWFMITWSGDDQLQSLKIREFAFHQVNANLLWPGTRIFAEWLIKHPNLLCGRKILELGRFCSLNAVNMFQFSSNLASVEWPSEYFYTTCNLYLKEAGEDLSGFVVVGQVLLRFFWKRLLTLTSRRLIMMMRT